MPLFIRVEVRGFSLSPVPTPGEVQYLEAAAVAPEHGLVWWRVPRSGVFEPPWGAISAEPTAGELALAATPVLGGSASEPARAGGTAGEPPWTAPLSLP